MNSSVRPICKNTRRAWLNLFWHRWRNCRNAITGRRCRLNLTVNKYSLHEECHIELSREIKMKKAVVNVQSMDNACFAWSVVAALHSAKKHTERESSYPHYSTVLNLTGSSSFQWWIKLKDLKVSTISPSMFISKKSKKKFFHYGLPIERGANMSISCMYRIHATIYNIGHFAWIKDLFHFVSSNQ